MPAPYLGYQPNILVVRTDDAPLDCYTNQGMPKFVANWASAFSDLSANSVDNVALCCPSRVAGLIGQTVWRHGVDDNESGNIIDNSGNFLEACHNVGFYTAIVGKYMNPQKNGNSAFDKNDKLGCDERYVFDGSPGYIDYDRYEASTYGDANVVHYGHADADYTSDVDGANILAIMARAVAKNMPFCIYWGAKAAHGENGDPLPPTRYTNTAINLVDQPNYGLDPAEHGGPQWMIDAAAGWDSSALKATHKNALRTFLGFDDNFDHIMSYLNTHGLLSKTVIILCTDNMHEYGGMRLDGKGTNRREATGMNLLVRQPSGVKVTRTQVVADFDIAPTVCALAGTTLKVMPDGMNFWPVIENANHAWRDGIPLKSRKGNVQYIGWWDKNGYSSGTGLAGTEWQGISWGWNGANDYYMINNVGADVDAIFKAQVFLQSIRLLITLA